MTTLQFCFLLWVMLGEMGAVLFTFIEIDRHPPSSVLVVLCGSLAMVAFFAVIAGPLLLAAACDYWQNPDDVD